MIDCIIFDLDGTLIDSETHCLQALNDVVPELDRPLSELSQRYRGRKLVDIFDDVEATIGRTLPHDIEHTYREQVDLLFDRHLVAFPGVHDALKNLSSTTCIASGGPRRKISKSLTRTDFAEYFGDRIFSSYDIESWKPDPPLFLHTAQAMGARPELCVVVEDSEVGIAAAEAAGMKVVHFCETGLLPLHPVNFSDYSMLSDALSRAVAE